VSDEARLDDDDVEAEDLSSSSSSSRSAKTDGGRGCRGWSRAKDMVACRSRSSGARERGQDPCYLLLEALESPVKQEGWRKKILNFRKRKERS
jgi:hypothetical protein